MKTSHSRSRGDRKAIALPALASFLCTTMFLSAQRDWQFSGAMWDAPFVMAFDHVNQQVLAFESLDTTFGPNASGNYSWDGTRWRLRRSETMPYGGQFKALVTDPLRQRLVLVNNPGPGCETWEWDGMDWQVVTTRVSLPALFGFAMAFDAARQRVVLFGGQSQSSYPQDTWEYDGLDWVQRTSATLPDGRRDHTMAYDAARRRIVMFGGYRSSTEFGDTWTWDGDDWTLAATTGPEHRTHEKAMTWVEDEQRVLLFDGYHSTTWAWDGTSWTQLQPAVSPPPCAVPALGYDGARGSTLLRRGVGHGGGRNDTWRWDDGAWTQVDEGVPGQGTMAQDPVTGAAMMVGGDTWRWEGDTWLRLHPQRTPPEGRYPMALDPLRRRTVLCAPGATWEWDGVDWSSRPSAHTPPDRTDAAACWDGTRNAVLLFGGTGATGLLDDMWLWNGSDWTEVTPALRPSPRSYPALAWDAARSRVLLHGGFDAHERDLADTWEWDGNAWHLRATGTASGWLACEGAHGRIVLTPSPAFGLIVEQTIREWTGVEWTVTARFERGHLWIGTTYDERAGAMVGIRAHTETWLYQGPLGYAGWRPSGRGCNLDLPRLDAPQPPLLGSDMDVIGRGFGAERIAILFLGLSDRTWNGLPLPVDLTGLGMPACELGASGELLALALNVGGEPRWTLPIPTWPGLLGCSFYCQGMALDAAANPFGALLTQAWRATVGDRIL